MATSFGHAAAGVAISSLLSPKEGRWRIIAAATLLAVLPDIDVLAFHIGVPYASPFGHRGFTHSILFCTILSLGCAFLLRSRRFSILKGFTLTFIPLFFSMLSHSLLDAMTTGGLGSGFFIPFDDSRYFLPWRPIKVSPVTSESFFGPRGLAVLKSEWPTIFLPALWIIASAVLLRISLRVFRPQGVVIRRYDDNMVDR